MQTIQSSSATSSPRPSGQTLKSTNPATGEVLGEVPVHSAEEVRQAVARARAAQESWGLLSVTERCRRLDWFKEALVTRAEELSDLIARENGKPRFEALTNEVLVVAVIASYYVKNGPALLAPQELDLQLFKQKKAYIHRPPLGVVGILSPWNMPLSIATCDLFAALVAGNAVVVKPSEVTPLVVLRAKEIYDAAGLPPDLFQVVTGGPQTGAALIDGGVDKIVFTGSVAGGRKVAAACGERLIPCTLELGGKAAVIVCDDADLERAARAIVWGGFANNGQVCVGVERVLAHESIYDRLAERVVELASRIRMGDPTTDEIDVGAITFPRQIEVAEKLIADAVAKGAAVRVGGKRAARPGQFFEPTVLTGCTEQMAVMHDEIFGPVVPIMKVADDREAIRIANDSPLGLAGYVFTKNRERGQRLAEQVRAGAVQINDVLSGFAIPEAPFGGVKSSGIGRVHGKEGLLSMTETRVVSYERFGAFEKDPTWFPYSNKAYRLALKAGRLMFGPGGLFERLGSALG